VDGVKKCPIVLIKWIDTTESKDWQDVEEAEKLEPLHCVSVGHLLKKTRWHITICISLTSDGGAGGTWAISRRCVESIEELQNVQ